MRAGIGEEMLMSHDVPPEMLAHYATGYEAGRLAQGSSQIEVARTQRIVRPGGVVLAVGISRFVSTLDGMRGGYLDDPVFVGIVRDDRASGQHRNPTNHPAYFTTSYFHHPTELKAEVQEAGLIYERTVGIEGPSWLIACVQETWDDPERRIRYLDALRSIEEEPTLLGISQHLMI